MVDLLALRVLHLRIGNVLHLDLAGSEIHDTTITRHSYSSLSLWVRMRGTKAERHCTGNSSVARQAPE
ncbi:hypothetical protein D3C71_2043610 [compost metagenome]